MEQRSALSPTYRRTAGAVWRRVGDQVIVLAPGAPQPVLLSGTAVALWEQLAEAATGEHAAARLAALYRTDADAVASDLAPALSDLCDRGVLQMVPDR